MTNCLRLNRDRRRCPPLRCFFRRLGSEVAYKTTRRGLAFVIMMLACLAALPGVAIAQSGMRINEVCFKPQAGESQWVELYHSGKVQEDISGYVLTDEDGSDYVFPAELPPVPPGAFAVVYFDGAGSAGNDYDFADNIAELHSDPGVLGPFNLTFSTMCIPSDVLIVIV